MLLLHLLSAGMMGLEHHALFRLCLRWSTGLLHAKQLPCQLDNIPSPYFQFCFIFYMYLFVCKFMCGPEAHVWES